MLFGLHILAFALTCGASLGALGYRQQRQTADPLSFDWYALEPSEDIVWTRCFDDDFQCARLTVPLDHADPDADDPKAQLALQLIPATDKANYQGTVLVNPGGPGDSGTAFILASRDILVDIIGPTFDILGFDVRGTGATLPLAQCFNSTQEYDAWARQEVRFLRVGDNSIPLARARDQVFSALCAEKISDFGRFVDASSTAADMLYMLEKFGQDKLLFYGRSYGSILGQFFATLYPQKVGRMILDGVVDGQSWQDGTDFLTSNVVDVDRLMDKLFANCAMTGPEKCAIWEPTASAVSRRVDRIIASLEKEPIPIPTSATGPLVLTVDAALGVVLHQLFFPMTGFPTLVTLFRAIELRDATAPILALVGSTPTSSATAPPWLQPNQVFQTIACADYGELDGSLAADAAAVRRATAVSRWAGPLNFARLRITCGAWSIRAKNRYAGPLAAKLETPMLFVSSRLDPGTPLSGARVAASRFDGTRLLIHETLGHTASGNPNSCAFAAMKAYMANGTLPPVGTVCPADSIPLLG
ncbi:alpha/beta-hydrolase [Exidia glandulosa HHB12029]|uniref:Alpha/beta-hydrolase n=1 Tax=Exidia glandulosa HHB12029 TaxID=1314781 RepID=A0A166BFE7_EXIGL|nr:alpha/beta-hydrolase [Exidia glandulosa HHB12029]